MDYKVLVHDAAGLSYELWFGLDLTATDDIDPLLGESDLPPPPPANAFDARFWIPPFNGALSSWRDYRAPGDPPAFPFVGTKDHVIKFQSTDFPITISWDLPQTIDTSSVIKDPFDFQVLSFSGTDSMVVTLSAIPSVEITVNYIDVVGIEAEDDLTPDDYALLQNFPNPFNPSTSIKFKVPETSNVTLRIYDMLGQEVRTLFNGEVQSGTYTVNWDGLNNSGVQMSSGNYVYRMIANGFVQSKKMILFK
jgi:FlgD Ig-like domain